MPAFLVQTSLKTTIVLVAAWLLTRAMTRSSAAARHFVWTLALVAALVLPLVQLVVPRWDLRVLAVPPTYTGGVVLSEPWTGDAGEPALPSMSAASSDPDQARARSIDLSWLAVAMAVWVAGLAVALVRLAGGLAWVSRMTRDAGDIDDVRWTESRDRLAAALGITMPVAVKISPEATIPVTCGIWRPTILLPGDAARWPDERREVVLLHELAHVARRDCFVQALARLACAVHWFNPFAYVAAAELRAEQERAADDLVLASGTEPPVYADHLFELARTARSERYPAWATVAMARPSQIEGRLIDILDDRRNRQPPGRAVRGGVAAASVAVLLPIGALQVTAAPAAGQAPPVPPSIDLRVDMPAPSPNPIPAPAPLPSPGRRARRRRHPPSARRYPTKRAAAWPMRCSRSSAIRTRTFVNRR